MNVKKIGIIIVVIAALLAANYWYVHRSSKAYLLPPAKPTQASTIQGDVPSQATTPTKQNPNSGVAAEVRQKLVEIQNLPPEERGKAIREFREKMMKEHGAAPPITPPTSP